ALGRFPIYNLGLAVVWTPGFLLAHGFCKLTGLAAADGMSFPYQLSVVLTSLLVIFWGFCCLRRFLLARFSDGVVALTLLGIGLGTNLFYYLVEGPDMTHAYLFSGYAVLLWHFSRGAAERRRSRRWLLACGLMVGLLCLIRSSEIVVFALPALYGLRDGGTLRRNFWRTLTMFGVACCVFSLQLLYYKIGTGAWFRDGYAGLGFDWLSPHLYEGFFGYRRGWLVYTPLMAFALVGIGWLRKRWLLPILIFTLANCYLLFSWHIWWYGDTFGSRPVVQSYAVLSLPLAAFLGAVAGARGRTKKLGRGLVVGLICGCIALNLFQHWQYNQRIIPLDFTNKTYYWHVFGKTTLDKKDRVYLDTNEKLPDRDWRRQELLAIDTIMAIPPKASREFTNLLEHRLGQSKGATWLRNKLVFSYYGETYDKWKFPGVITEVQREGETIKWVQVKVPPTMETPALDSLRFEISVPEARAGDVLKVYIWNLSQDSMAVRRARVDLLNN
ncbi:MAG: hypothetical protein AAFZ52_14940, partial [Bacteroidota bacterium]